MTAKVVQFKQIGAVTFLKSRRSKNIKISVKPDQSVHVSFPFYVTSPEVTRFLLKNVEWVASQQQKFKSKKNTLAEGDILQTKLHRIVFLKGTKNKTTVNYFDIEIVVPDLNSPDSQKYIENVVTGVYRFEAKKILPPRLSELAQIHQFKFNKVTMRNNRRNWGSCSSKNNISLNLQMMKLPDNLIDYILLHELVHTEIKNHGPKFWEKLNALTNNRARELAKEVRKYSTYTL